MTKKMLFLTTITLLAILLISCRCSLDTGEFKPPALKPAEPKAMTPEEQMHNRIMLILFVVACGVVVVSYAVKTIVEEIARRIRVKYDLY